MSAKIKDEHRLKGADDYALWRRRVQAVLGEEGLVDHVFVDATELVNEVMADYPVPTAGATAAEISRQKAALRKHVKDATIAFSLTYNGLSETVQNKLPDEYASFKNPNPKGLYEYLERTYGASSGTRQAELWSSIFGSDIGENEDPEPALAEIRRAGAEIVAAGKALTVEDFADSVLAYAAIRRLPDSYGLLASTFMVDKDAITLDTVIERVSAEYRRRQTKGQVVNEHGLLSQAKKSGERGKGRASGLGDKWCEKHQCKGHSTAECRGLKTGWLPLEEYRKKKEKEKGLEANEGDEGNETDKAPERASFIEEVSLNAVEALAANEANDLIILDSGATSPFIKDLHLLSDLVRLDKAKTILVGNGGEVLATHKGTLRFKNARYEDAYYTPRMSHNLLAVDRLGPESLGAKWEFSRTSAELRTNQGRILLTCRRAGKHWVVAEPAVRALADTSLSATEPTDLEGHRLLRWHCRLGHIDMKKVWDLGKAGKLGKAWSGEFQRVECISCLVGKTVRNASKPNERRSQRPLVNVSVDLWGPPPVASRLGYRYFLTCYDDYSRYLYVAGLKNKAETHAAIKTYSALVENQLDRSIKTIRSDQGGEFTSNEHKEWARTKGIELAYTPTAAHDQNGRVERAHLTIMNDVRTYLDESKLDKKFWFDALEHSVYSRNRIPNKDGKTPLELFKEGSANEVDYEQMYSFGTRCVYRVTTPPSKLEARGLQGRIIGYGTGTSAYRVLTDLGTVLISRDVRALNEVTQAEVRHTPGTSGNEPRHLDETGKLNEADPNEIPNEADEPNEAVEAPVDAPEGAPRPEGVPVQEPARPANRHIGYRYELNREGAPSPEAEEAPIQEPEAQRPNERDERDEEGVEGPRRSGRLQHRAPIYQPLHEVDTVTGYIAEHALSTQEVNNPTSYKQARDSPNWTEWKGAMDEEMEKMSKYGVWEAVPDEGQRALSGKWVYTRKIDGDTGLPKAFKARFVVRGFLQREGLDYGELHASVAHKDSNRVFLSIVNYFDLDCDQTDIVGAFLQSEVDKVIYVRPPDGSGFPAGTLLRLRKSLYGLKQSPHLFNKELDKYLRSQGLVPCDADPCIYVRWTDTTILMVSLHVDDQLIASNCRNLLNEFKRALNEKFECKDQGPVGYFLGVNVHRDRVNRKLYLSQEHYLTALIDRFGETGNPCKTALPSGWKPRAATDEEFNEARDKPYPSLVGSILYAATVTRPDLAYPASVLCRYLSKWSLDHWKAAKHLLRYISGTRDLCLMFDADAGKRVLLGWADADWGGCADTRRSTTGYVFSTFGGTVAWKSKRQATVALSTTQAELLASTEAGKQAIWLRQLLNDLGLGLSANEAVIVKNDNLGAITLAKHQHGFKVNKAFDIRAQWLREHTDNGILQLEHVPTDKNRADLLTKSFTEDKTRQLRELAGVRKRE